MPAIDQQESRGQSLRIRTADGIAAALVGWLILAKFIDQFRPDTSRLGKDLLLLAFSALCGLAGLLLVDLAASLERRTAATGKIIPLIRLAAAAVVGGFLLTKFLEGCFAALAVIFFVIFLALVFRALDAPGQIPEPSPVPASVVPDDQPRAAPYRALQPSVMASGVRGKVDSLLAMIVSGTTTGFLVGFARYYLDSSAREQSLLAGKLLPISIIMLSLLIRFATAWLIQGREHLKGWKAGLVGVDGLLAGVLLAAAMSSERMPFSVYFQHLLERNPISWILAGTVLGLVFGLAMSLIANAFGRGFKKYLFGGETSGLAVAGTDGAVALPASPVHSVVIGGQDSKEKSLGGVEENPVPPQPPSRRSTFPQSAGRIGCSCLIAPVALFASFVFLFIHEKVFPPKGPSKSPAELPAGCPPKCEAMILDNFDLSGVDLSGASFAKTRLPDSILRGANLRGANLRETYLFWVDLSDADLSEADLSGADLRKAILIGARLERTNLRGAYLRQAALQDLDLSTADLQGADLRDASYSKGTLWPPGFDVEGAGMYLTRDRK